MDKVLNWRGYLVEPHMREMLLGSLAGLTVKVLAAISLFVMNVVVTRSVGAEQAGLFFLAFTLVTIVATVGRVGLDQAIVRFIAEDRAAKGSRHLHDIYAKAVKWAFLATLLLASGLWLSANWLSHTVFSLPAFEVVFKSMVVAAPVFAVFVIHAQALQGLKQVSKSMLVASVALPVCILVLILMAPAQSAETLGQYFLIGCLATLLLGRMFWLKSVPRTETRKTFSASLLRQTCTSLWVVAVVHQVIQWSSQLLLAVWSSSESVAFFATAQRTAMLTSFILFAVNTIAAPKFASMHAAGDRQNLKRMALMSVRIMLLVAVPVTAAIMMFPEWLMSLFGEEFRQAAPALVILAVGQFINIATGSVGYLLSMTGNERKVRDNVVISGSMSVLLGFALIPTYGVTGAAFAYACGVASQNLLGVYQVKKHLGFNTLMFWKA